MKIRDVLLALALLINGIALGIVVGRCSVDGERDTLSVRVDSFRDTMYVEVHDTVPTIKQEKVVCYVKIPTKNEHDGSDTLKNCDSLNMAVVQREYSDDSTYTAWVSGVRYAEWPKLDSISVRQREIVKTMDMDLRIRASSRLLGLEFHIKSRREAVILSIKLVLMFIICNDAKAFAQ